MEQVTFATRCDFYSLEEHLWDSALDKWKAADLETRKKVWERVKWYADYILADYERPVDIGDINNMIWMECDDLFYPDSE